ncbi:hypothetical protein PSEUBRA_003159 [Kalmanozyma brasiliensis GHG001]|uniref:uncharacterized protein n=1 Tax=Kalmanozyma brasiliensis (strain GHG001) TaxID=1365824 RepID=UPI001CE90A40|nr:uncharacterized protein PSEUBRA_003159 [Kalmanozyma brasiliensis GHG001]KAF6767195.1 hypothetical protein PSEUBRA_003159 [Kalmanozyma brasiliensis GHG001]
MFLPRKLQKRSQNGRTIKQRSASVATELSVRDDGDAREDRGSVRFGSTPGSTQDASSPELTGRHQDVASQPASRSISETGKLDRLVDFLFLRLSPLSLVLSARGQANRGLSLAELVRGIIGDAKHPEADGSKPAVSAEASNVHLARLLSSLPGLNSRCKSISLLAEALHEAQKGPAAGWFTVHHDTFQLEWSPSFVGRLRELSIAAESAATLSTSIAPLLIYIESIPPRIRTRAQASSYLAELLRSSCEGPEHGMVLNVLEPSLVDGQLMSGMDTLASASLEGKWISGRGFFLLNSPAHVNSLCKKYEWDLALRGRSTKRSEQGQESPIRCLSWTGWVEMRQSYLDWQRRAQQDNERDSSAATAAEDDASLSQGDVGATHDHNGITSSAVVPDLDASKDEDHWYRGTILLLRLPPPSNSTLIIPPFSSASDLTPAFLNRHLKPQLEQHVPESISYIHVHNPDSSSSTDDLTVAIRTAHPTYATKLTTHFPALLRMDAPAEDAYWSALPPKVRSSAHSRFLALDRTLS